MTYPREYLEEYLDGLLEESERKELEEQLRSDPELRAELERVERFERMLDVHAHEAAVQEIQQRMDAERRSSGTLFRLFVATAAAAAALVLWVSLRPQATDPHTRETFAELRTEWVTFGSRLGRMANERRAGRVPRTGLGDLDVPPDRAAGVVFGAALQELGVRTDALEHAKDLVRAHFISMPREEDVDAEYRRTQAALDLYRELRQSAGAAVADAYYDVFRPGIAALRSARRVPPGTLFVVVGTQVSASASVLYQRAYRDAVALLSRRYGDRNVALVLGRLAPDDRRYVYRDAAQDGISRDAVLAIRARFYQAALSAGVDKLYVDLG